MFAGKMTQYARKLTQIAFILAQTVETDVLKQNHFKCGQTKSTFVQTGTNRAKRCFLAKKIKMRAN
jgi:hypothetical protein